MINLEIYQINSKRDKNHVMFLGYKTMLKHQKGGFDSWIYDKVYEGRVNADSLDDVYILLNSNYKPDGYEGRSLSVSDIISVSSSDCGITASDYYVDSIGFKEVILASGLTQDARSKKITVIAVEPGKPAKRKIISSALGSMQKFVDGYIEVCYPFDDPDICIICNEEGKYTGLEPCRAIYNGVGKLQDIIYGAFLICRVTHDGDFNSLNEDEIKMFEKLYKIPEKFYTQNGEIHIEKCPLLDGRYKEDRIFVDVENDLIMWLYYNPDAESGGQFVCNRFDYKLLDEAYAIYPYDADNIFEYVGLCCKQELIDIDAPKFKYWDYVYRTVPFATETTYNTVMRIFEEYKKNENKQRGSAK